MVLLTSRPRRIEDSSGKDLGDEYMFYDADGDAVHVLNGTAREVYLLCDGNRAVDEIVRTVVERYEVDEDTARRDVSDVLDRLVALHLVAVS